ncbi:recombinase family protein [Nocardiopsis algeriensis]|uniref:Resolvase/invertase-type recombinase catalytic domain-containing protein n=1 Tax=Nocardiopsis algeriensis TaxID=1478215 RepID=A0A841ITY6_9ACTN|nr:recombinase family protein [Nocardiopsis algeriensis]MBB6119711.1 hypothetical protein [Nocardiopsis algeriensis]
MDEEVQHVEQELAQHAAGEGFPLSQVFIEGATHAEPAFRTMLDALKRHGVKDVIVPSLWHFARLPGLQEAMREHIEHETGARIWVVQGQR